MELNSQVSLLFFAFQEGFDVISQLQNLPTILHFYNQGNSILPHVSHFKCWRVDKLFGHPEQIRKQKGIGTARYGNHRIFNIFQCLEFTSRLDADALRPHFNLTSRCQKILLYQDLLNHRDGNTQITQFDIGAFQDNLFLLFSFQVDSGHIFNLPHIFFQVLRDFDQIPIVKTITCNG